MQINPKYQLSKVRRSLRTVRDPLIRERLRFVKAYYDAGSLRTAGAACCSNRGTVKFWLDRYTKEGIRGLASRPKSGRPPKLDRLRALAIKRVVIRECGRQHWQVKRVRHYIYEHSGVRYSVRHTIRILQRWGLVRLRPRPQYAYARQVDKRAFLKDGR